MATAAQVAKEVKNQGGSDQQAWVAAALVSGIESNGSPTDKNPTSTACGLFQFLTTTWISNGGGKYAPTACGATWQQQVSVYLTASQGNNFYPWAPDLGGSYNGNAIYGPKSGSPVANKLYQLAAGGTLGFLGNLPSSWAGPGGASATSGPSSLIPGGGNSGYTITGNPTTGQTVTANPGTNCTPVISGLTVTILNSCQAQELLGGLLIVVGGLFFIVGFGIVLADMGLRKSAPAIVGAVVGRRSGKRAGEKEAYQRGLGTGAAPSQTPEKYSRATGNPPPSINRTARANGEQPDGDF